MRKILFLIGVLLSFTACEELIEVEDISHKTVNILAPTQGSILNKTTLSFSWELVDASENYHLQVATPGFENAQQIVKDTILTGTHYLTTLEAKNYQWRVRAQNSGYTTAYTTQSFAIEN